MCVGGEQEGPLESITSEAEPDEGPAVVTSPLNKCGQSRKLSSTDPMGPLLDGQVEAFMCI